MGGKEGGNTVFFFDLVSLWHMPWGIQDPRSLGAGDLSVQCETALSLRDFYREPRESRTLGCSFAWVRFLRRLVVGENEEAGPTSVCYTMSWIVVVVSAQIVAVFFLPAGNKRLGGRRDEAAAYSTFFALGAVVRHSAAKRSARALVGVG